MQLDCKTCQSFAGPPLRQQMGCGWLAPVENPGQVWHHNGDLGTEATVCAGYTTQLPEVMDIVRHRLHWEKGALPIRLAGAEPPSTLLDGIEALHYAVERYGAWRSDPKRGGAQ